MDELPAASSVPALPTLPALYPDGPASADNAVIGAGGGAEVKVEEEEEREWEWRNEEVESRAVMDSVKWEEGATEEAAQDSASFSPGVGVEDAEEGETNVKEEQVFEEQMQDEALPVPLSENALRTFDRQAPTTATPVGSDSDSLSSARSSYAEAAATCTTILYPPDEDKSFSTADAFYTSCDARLHRQYGVGAVARPPSTRRATAKCERKASHRCKFTVRARRSSEDGRWRIEHERCVWGHSHGEEGEEEERADWSSSSSSGGEEEGEQGEEEQEEGEEEEEVEVQVQKGEGDEEEEEEETPVAGPSRLSAARVPSKLKRTRLKRSTKTAALKQLSTKTVLPRAKPITRRADKTSSLHVNLPSPATRFPSLDHARVALLKAILPVYGITVTLSEGHTVRPIFRCSRYNTTTAKPHRCRWSIRLRKAHDGQWAIDGSTLQDKHNHGPAPELLADPNWRPWIKNPFAREALKNAAKSKGSATNAGSKGKAPVAAKEPKKAPEPTATDRTTRLKRRKAQAGSDSEDERAARLKRRRTTIARAEREAAEARSPSADPPSSAHSASAPPPDPSSRPASTSKPPPSTPHDPSYLLSEPANRPLLPPPLPPLDLASHPFHPSLSSLLASISPSLTTYTTAFLAAGIDSVDALIALSLLELEMLEAFVELVKRRNAMGMSAIQAKQLAKGLRVA